MATAYRAANRKMSQERVDRYARELKRLEKTGPLTPERVREEAKKKTSPLHDWFDWDEKTAAYKYQLEQARQLVRTILIEVEEIEESSRAFLSVVTDDGEREYRSTRVVMQTPDLRTQVLDEILGRIRYWRRTHKQLKDLAVVLDKTEREIRRLKKK